MFAAEGPAKHEPRDRQREAGEYDRREPERYAEDQLDRERDSQGCNSGHVGSPREPQELSFHYRSPRTPQSRQLPGTITTAFAVARPSSARTVIRAVIRASSFVVFSDDVQLTAEA